MPAELEPPELARLVDFAERPRVGDWSLRSALVRYAQGQPRRVSQVLELVRRIDAALHPHAKLLAAQGPDLWTALTARAVSSGPEGFVVEVLRAAALLDEVADGLAAWAEDQGLARPDAAVDAAVAEVARRLDVLGVAREPRTPAGRGVGERARRRSRG